MARRVVCLVLPLVLAGAGCLPQDAVLVRSNPFATDPVPPPSQAASASPATNEQATRVALIGQKLVAANPQLDVRPLFRTLAVAQVEAAEKPAAEEPPAAPAERAQAARPAAPARRELLAEPAAAAALRRRTTIRTTTTPISILL